MPRPKKPAESAAKPTKSAAEAGPRAAESASGTNNQVVGVDEADIVKTDGRYVYLAINGALRIVEALNPKVTSVTRLPGDVREVFIEGDRAVVYTASGRGSKKCTYAYDCQFAGDGTATRITVLDVSDRTDPKQVRQIDFSGSLMPARRIGRTIHTVVSDNDAPTADYETWPADLDMCGNKEYAVRAKFNQLKIENERKIRQNIWFSTIKEKGMEKQMCAGLLETKMKDGQAFTTLASFDMFDDATPAVTATIQSRPGAVSHGNNPKPPGSGVCLGEYPLPVGRAPEKRGAKRALVFILSIRRRSERDSRVPDRGNTQSDAIYGERRSARSYRSNWLMAIKSLSLMVIKCSVGMRRYNDAHRLTTLPACSLLATSRSRHARRARQACARLRVAPSAQLPFAARAGKPFVWAMGRRMPPAGAPDPGCSTSNILSEIDPYKPIYLDR